MLLSDMTGHHGRIQVIAQAEQWADWVSWAGVADRPDGVTG